MQLIVLMKLFLNANFGYAWVWEKGSIRREIVELLIDCYISILSCFLISGVGNCLM